MRNAARHVASVIPELRFITRHCTSTSPGRNTARGAAHHVGHVGDEHEGDETDNQTVVPVDLDHKPQVVDWPKKWQNKKWYYSQSKCDRRFSVFKVVLSKWSEAFANISTNMDVYSYLNNQQQAIYGDIL